MGEPRSPSHAENGQIGPPDAEQQVERLAEQFLAQLQAGQTPDRAAWVVQHLELAPALERRLALVERMHHAGQAARSTPPPEDVSAIPGPEVPHATVDGRPAVGGFGGVGSPAPNAQPAPNARPAPSEPAQAGLPERALRLQCPHCGNRIQLVAPQPQEVTCQNCGSSFRVEPAATADYRPEQLPPSIGKFQVLELLGRGAFGAVYKARDPELDRIVAIKVPRAGYFSTPEEEQRFLREARHAARLRHGGIVSVYEIAHAAGLLDAVNRPLAGIPQPFSTERQLAVAAALPPYIVSEYIEGLTLADLLTGGRPGYRETAELIARVAEALDYAHCEKVVHRDIKPGNILIDRARQPHLTDFGLARRDEGEITVTLDGQILGTPAYMSPEQAAGEHHRVDRRSDVYSLGVVLYELLTGELPFRGNKRMLLHQVLHDEPRPPRRVNDGIPRDLETICLKALAKEPGRRYATARDLADDLRRHLSGEPIHARPVGRAERFWRWSRRNPVVASLAAAVVLCLLLGTGIASFFAMAARREAANARDQEAVAVSKADEAEVNLDLSRRRLYVSDMRLAQRAWEDLQPSRLVELLDGQRPEQTGGTDYRGFEWYYWQRVRNSHLRSFEGHTDQVTSIAFSPDGSQLATGSKDKTVKVWDAATGQERLTLTGHTGAVTCLGFSPDSKRIAASCQRLVKVWDLPHGQKTLSLTLDQSERIAQIVFSPDGRLLAAAAGQVDVWPGVIQLWDAATGQALEPIEIDDEGLESVAFSADGRHLASGSWNYLKIWEVASRREVLNIDREENASRVIFSPDGRWLASTYNERPGTVKVFDVADGKELGKFESQAKRMECLAFSPDGTRLATHSKDDDAAMGVEIWDLASGREVFRLKLPDHWEEWPVTFSPDLRQVAAGWGRTVRLWDATGHPEAILCRGGANSLAFAPDDRRLALAGGTVRICDASAGQELRKFGQETTGAVFGPGGEWLAAARGTEVIFWNLSSGQELLTVKGPADPRGEAMPRPGISSLAVSPDGRWLAVGTSRDTPGGPGQIEVCRIPDLRPSPDKPSPASSSADPVLLLKGHKYRVTSLAFSPDGTQLASASDDGAMKLWDVPSLVALAADQQKAGLAPDQIEAALAQRACTLTGHSSVAYSPDGKLLATAGPNATVRLCDPATGREVRVFRGHTRAVNCVAFSPDGKQLVSGSGDWSEPGELKLWDVACGQELLSLVAPDGVQCVAFSHCGRRLAVNAPVGRSFSHPHPADSSKWAWNITLIPAGRPLCQPDLTVASVHILDARPLTDETRLQREAVSLYRHAAQTQLLQDEVADQIRQDRSVTAAVRQQALAWTQHFQGNRNRLNEASRAIVQPADADAAEYRRALRYAVAADRLMPDTIEHLNTLGMAQYRVGQYQEALVALTRARDLILAKDKSERAPHASQPPPPDEDPEARTIPLGTTFLILVENPAFLAMTQHRLGQKEQSRATLHELHKIIRALKKSDWDAYEGRWGAFLREAETLVEGDAEPKESEPKKPKSETRPKDE